MRGKTKGFTLIEIVTVVGIIFLMSTIIVPNFTVFRKSTKNQLLSLNTANVDNFLYTQYRGDEVVTTEVIQKVTDNFIGSLKNPETDSNNVREIGLTATDGTGRLTVNYVGSATDKTLSLGYVNLDLHTKAGGEYLTLADIQTIVTNTLANATTKTETDGAVIAFIGKNGYYVVGLSQYATGIPSIDSKLNETVTVPTDNIVRFYIVDNGYGIPKIQLEPGMPLNVDYIVKIGGSSYTISNTYIGLDGAIALIPKSAVNTVQMAFFATPTILSYPLGIDAGMSSGNTPPELVINSVVYYLQDKYKANITIRDLDASNTVYVKYKVENLDGTPYVGFSSIYNAATTVDPYPIFSMIGVNSANTVDVAITTPAEPYKVIMWSEDNLGAKSVERAFVVK